MTTQIVNSLLFKFSMMLECKKKASNKLYGFLEVKDQAAESVI